MFENEQRGVNEIYEKKVMDLSKGDRLFQCDGALN